MAPSRVETLRIPVVLHGDLLDPWCWIVERRVLAALEPFDGRFAPLVHAPFPRRWEPRVPSAAERRARTREITRAAREKDAPPLSTELWTSPAPPCSSVPPLLAATAARLQGLACEVALRAALREAALVRGLDVSRPDVLAEVASRTPGLDLARFLSALRAPATERALRDAVVAAADRGVEASPALVVGEEWLVTGPHDVPEYQRILRRYLARSARVPAERTVH